MIWVGGGGGGRKSIKVFWAQKCHNTNTYDQGSSCAWLKIYWAQTFLTRRLLWLYFRIQLWWERSKREQMTRASRVSTHFTWGKTNLHMSCCPGKTNTKRQTQNTEKWKDKRTNTKMRHSDVRAICALLRSFHLYKLPRFELPLNQWEAGC